MFLTMLTKKCMEPASWPEGDQEASVRNFLAQRLHLSMIYTPLTLCIGPLLPTTSYPYLSYPAPNNVITTYHTSSLNPHPLLAHSLSSLFSSCTAQAMTQSALRLAEGSAQRAKAPRHCRARPLSSGLWASASRRRRAEPKSKGSKDTKAAYGEKQEKELLVDGLYLYIICIIYISHIYITYIQCNINIYIYIMYILYIASMSCDSHLRPVQVPGYR